MTNQEKDLSKRLEKKHKKITKKMGLDNTKQMPPITLKSIRITRIELLKERLKEVEDELSDIKMYLDQLPAHNWYQKYYALRRKIENHIIMSEDFKAEYNSWLDSLNDDNASR